MKLRPFIVPAILVVFSVVVIGVSLQLDTSPPMIVGDAMQPRAFPIFLMVLNLILVGVLVAQFVKYPPKPVALEPFATWGSIGLMLLFFVLTTWVDMFVGIAVVMFLMAFLWGERRIWVAATVALTTCISIFLLFDEVLEVRFPRGLFTNWYYG